MCARLEAEDTADERVEGDIGDGLRDLSSWLEVGADSLEDGVHLRILIVEAMSSMEEVLGDALGAEEDLCAEVCDEYQLTDAGAATEVQASRKLTLAIRTDTWGTFFRILYAVYGIALLGIEVGEGTRSDMLKAIDREVVCEVDRLAAIEGLHPMV